MALEIDGVHTFEWPIKGMDCPDCAAKAKRATQRLPGVRKDRHLRRRPAVHRRGLELFMHRVEVVGHAAQGESASEGHGRCDGQAAELPLREGNRVPVVV